jgi:hypothetical protein
MVLLGSPTAMQGDATFPVAASLWKNKENLASFSAPQIWSSFMSTDLSVVTSHSHQGQY